jgi:hypothetical protein
VEANSKVERLEAFRLAFSPERNPPNSGWGDTLELASGVVERLRAADEQIQSLEGRHAEIMRVLARELNAAQERVQSADQRAQEAEDRANDAENLARQNREWLMQVHNDLQNLPGGAPSSVAEHKR